MKHATAEHGVGIGPLICRGIPYKINGSIADRHGVVVE
jgi:hypothetical protein